ncbi:MAG: serine protease [Candidatus Phytoplasma australasiaticum]|nr:serine protease [Candidatus Phytoplasma australasiaticum]MDV3153588.1 serine protease [Candidatus Phytoplasma australasiaticum]MDV3167427.1 serine protease [Candidatus Phytoplasma australasiaticum]MDV3180832.1 serine protease [Candidatus Phytoplasma australasiaticum]MDV3183022.1 serine protease [Candidatus Phytoplasma australasiaticum]
MNILRIIKKNYLLLLVYFFILITFIFYYFNYKKILTSNVNISIKYDNYNENIIDEENKNKYQIVEGIQQKLQKIFDNQQPTNNNLFPKIKKYNFHKGETVYGFTLDINDNIKPFQEGIISEEYDQNQSNTLSISIKGKNNKIFFNKRGEFIGISFPQQSHKMEINYIITSNYIYNFCERMYKKFSNHIKDKKIHNEYESDHESISSFSDSSESLTDEDDDSDFENLKSPQDKIKKQYLIPMELNSNQIENNPKIQLLIKLNKEGKFNGLMQQINNQYIDVSKKFLNTFALSFIDESFFEQSEKLKPSDIIQEDISKIIENISKITFSIEFSRYLGSGFIYAAEKSEKSSYYKYKYYIITNSHVLEPGKNSKIKVYNPYFNSYKDAKIFTFISNNEGFDDIGILTFQDNNATKFKEIEEILKTAFPEPHSFIKPEIQQIVYSMGSQESFALEKFLSSLTNIKNTQSIKRNLLKRGDITKLNEAFIDFNIEIDNGNSGGPVFNQKGQIIGMNRNTINNPATTDKFSQAINILHIQKRLEEIFSQHKQNPKNIGIITDLTSENHKNYLMRKLNSFKKNFNNLKIEHNDEAPMIAFSMDELTVLTHKDPITLPLLKNKENKSKIILKIKLVYTYNQQQILFIDPQKEYMELYARIDSQDKSKINLKIIIKNKNHKVINFIEHSLESHRRSANKDSSFVSLKFIDSNKPSVHTTKQKIMDSLIVWHQDHHIKGNGIIFSKEKTQDNQYLYHVLSTYEDNYENNLISLNNLLYKRIFNDQNEIIIYDSEQEIYKFEQGTINNIFPNENNIILITFKSSENYPVVPFKKTSDLKVGEDIYYLINGDSDDHNPQMFKSQISSIIENKNSTFVFDSVFNLKEKIKDINFICFDHKGNFIGINFFNNSNVDIPSNFIQATLISNNNLRELLITSNLKENLNILISVIFIFLVMIIISIKLNPIINNI